MIDTFVEEFEARDPEARLSRYFRNDDVGITRRSTNVEVASYLRQEAGDAVSRAIEIIRDRVDRYGVTEPSIQMQGSRRVIVEMPGIDDPERIRKLLKGTARLEFRLMADPQLYQEQDKFAECSKEYSSLERKLKRLYKRWEEVQAKVELIESEYEDLI